MIKIIFYIYNTHIYKDDINYTHEHLRSFYSLLTMISSTIPYATASSAVMM